MSGKMSSFAYLYDAFDFAYGINAKVAPLLVVGPTNGATGSQTLTLAYGYVNLPDGTIVNVLNANAPIVVGGDSGVDFVTPSAVSNLTPTQYSTSTITFSGTYAHSNGDQVRSGTIGLQEALNYAGSKGGGQVIVTPAWVNAGGTQAMLNAAVVPANVSIWDNRFGGNPTTTTITLTNAQILGMEATPVELLPAPSANSVYIINKATLVNLNTGTAYANGGAITIGYGTTASTNALASTIAATFLTSPTATELIMENGQAGTAIAGSSLLNEPIYITNASAPFITGTGTLQIQLEYSLLTT